MPQFRVAQSGTVMRNVPYALDRGRVAVSDEIAADGESGRGGSALDIELGEDAGDVVADGLPADREGGGDLPVGVSGGEQPEHVQFARGQGEVPAVVDLFRVG